MKIQSQFNYPKIQFRHIPIRQTLMVNEQRISSTTMVFVTSNSPELHLSLHARNNMLLDPPGIAYLSSCTHSTHVFSITHTSEPEHKTK